MNKLYLIFIFGLLYINPVFGYTINEPLNEYEFNHFRMNITFSSTVERNNIWQKITEDKHPNIINFNYILTSPLTYEVTASLKNYNKGSYLLCSHCSFWYLNSSWNNRTEIKINNSLGDTLTDYQKLLNISYIPSMQNDFDDLRFLNISDGSLLPYWIKNKTSNYINIWVNFSYIPSNSWYNNTYYMYYNNTITGNVSNGNNTFMFFEDCHNSVEKWTILGSKVSCENGTLKLGGSNGWGLDGAISKTFVTKPFILEFTHASSTTSSIYSSIGLTNGAFITPTSGGFIGTYLQDGYSVYVNGSALYHTAIQPNGNEYFSVKLISNESLSVYKNNTLLVYNSNPFTPNFIELQQYGNSGYQYINNIIVRKFTLNEPNYLFGENESYQQINITSWENNITNNQSLNFSTNNTDVLNQTTILFNFTTNINNNSNIWIVNGVDQLRNSTNLSFTFDVGNYSINATTYNQTYNNYDFKNWSVEIIASATTPTPTPTPTPMSNATGLNQSQYETLITHIDNSGSTGFIGGILGGCIAVAILRRKRKE